MIDTDLYLQIEDAIVSGDRSRVRELLSKHPEALNYDGGAGTGLHFAASVVRQADGVLFRAFRARATFSRMSSACFVHTNDFGLAL